MSKVDFNSEGTRRPPLVSVPFDHDPHRRSAVRWHELWSRGVQHGPYCYYCSSINKKTWASLRGYLVGTQQQIAPRFLVGGLGRPGFCPRRWRPPWTRASTRSSMSPSIWLELIRSASFSFVCCVFLFQSICRSGLQYCFWSASFEVLRSAFSCVLFVSI